MPLLRGRRDDGGTKYRMCEKLFAIGDEYWIEDEAGQHVFKVDGKPLRIRDTLVLEDRSGTERFTVQGKKLHIRDTMEVERDGKTVATVKKVMITPLRDRFSIGSRAARTWKRKATSSFTSARSSGTGRRSGGLEALVPGQGRLRERSLRSRTTH